MHEQRRAALRAADPVLFPLANPSLRFRLPTRPSRQPHGRLRPAFTGAAVREPETKSEAKEKIELHQNAKLYDHLGELRVQVILIPKFLRAVQPLCEVGLPQLVQLGQTLSAWSQEIIAMWRFTKNNGITEGFHNKMELINRPAYGFRNFEN